LKIIHSKNNKIKTYFELWKVFIYVFIYYFIVQYQNNKIEIIILKRLRTIHSEIKFQIRTYFEFWKFSPNYSNRNCSILQRKVLQTLIVSYVTAATSLVFRHSSETITHIVRQPHIPSWYLCQRAGPVQMLCPSPRYITGIMGSRMAVVILRMPSRLLSYSGCLEGEVCCEVFHFPMAPGYSLTLPAVKSFFSQGLSCKLHMLAAVSSSWKLMVRRMPSSGVWRRVDVVDWTDVSEDRIASIFKVEKSASEEPAWAGSCRTFRGSYRLHLQGRKIRERRTSVSR
jgi:hypothetical protein